MSGNKTDEETRRDYIDKMGESLGEQFHALWQQVALLHVKWAEGVALFSDPNQIELLNEVAPALFNIIEDVLWEDTILHIMRITDKSKVAGHNTLTIKNLPELVDAPIRLMHERPARVNLVYKTGTQL
jgi:hypothetical protein